MYIEEQGDVNVLTYGDLPDPIVKSNEVKIKVKACSINRLDLFARAGEKGVRLNLKTPHVLGGDVAGDVIECGDMVTDFFVGDRVVVNPHISCQKCKNCKLGAEELCLQSNFLGMTSNGGYAEYTTVPFYNVVHIPDSISYIEAAAVPTVFIPCWNMLFRKAKLQPNEKVLVVSASSGIGTAAIQLAKNISGVDIVATTSNLYKAQLIKEMGVNDVLLHTDENLNKKLMEITNNEGFNVLRNIVVVYDEKASLLFLLESLEISKNEIRVGPDVFSADYSTKFITINAKKSKLIWTDKDGKLKS